MPMRRLLWLILTLALSAAVAYRVGRTIVDALGELPTLRILRPAWLLPAVAVVGLAFAAAATGFARLVRAAGGEIAFADAFWATCAGNMGKYLPGKIWAVAGKAVLSRRAGVSLEASLVATALDVYLILATSVAVGGSLWALGDTNPQLGLAVLACVAVLVAAAHPVSFGWLSRLVVRRLPAAVASPVLGIGGQTPQPAIYSYRHVLEASAFYILFWLLLGLGFLFLAHALAAAGSGPSLMGGFILSYLVGIAAVFAPGGIGVREGVLHHLLTPVVGAGPSALLAVAGRVWVTLAEVVTLAAAGLISLRRSSAGA
jgi:glycosyltransferase 2 family protein